MALQKQYWEMVFGQAGRISRQDEKVLESPNLSELQNGEITAPGRIQKRHGYVSYEDDLTDDYGLDASNRCSNGRSLVAAGDFAVSGYDAINEWANDATAMNALSSVEKVISTPWHTWYNPDIAFYANRYYITASRYEYSGSTWDCRLFVFDSNFNLLHEESVVSGSEVPARLAVFYYGVYIFYWDSGSLYGVKIGGTTLTIGTPVNVGSSPHATIRYFDVCTNGSVSGDYCYISYATSTPGVRTTQLNSSLAAVNSANYTTYGAGDACIANHYNTETNKILVVFCVDGVDSYYVQYDTSVTQEYQATIYGSPAAPYARNFVIGSLSDRWLLFALFPISGTGITDTLQTITRCSYIQGSTRSIRSYLWSVGPVHKAAERINGHGPFFGIGRTQDNFNTNYTVEFRGTANYFSEPIAKYAYRLSSAITNGYSNQGFVPNCVVGADSKTLHYPIVYGDGTYNSIAIATFSHSASGDRFQKRFHTDLVGTSPVINGSIPLIWDGKVAREIGFSHPPVITDDTIGAGGSMADGDYSYIAVYYTKDKSGREYWSLPSEPYAVTISGMGGAADVDLEVTPPVCRPDWDTDDDDERLPAIVLYRTEDSGTIYYFVNSTQTTVWYNTDTTITALPIITDGDADADIIDNPTLYTTGDVLERSAPPPLDYITCYDNRLWGIDSETGNIYYSAEIIEGECPWFNVAYQVTSPINIGKPKALVETQSFLMVFYENAVGAIYGQGYNDLGTDGNLTSVKIIVNNIGVAEQKSIARTPNGIIFKSSSGFHLIGYDGSPPQYVGGGASDYDGSTVVSADVIQDSKHVRFVLSGTDDPILVYNYEFNHWYIWGYDIGGTWCTKSGGTVIDNVHYLVNADVGNTLVQDSGYLDGVIDGTYSEEDYSMVVTTPWIKLAGLQGFKRVLKAWILGTYISQHDMTVEIDYDYDDTNTDTVTLTDVGSSIDTDLYQVRIGVPQQRCQSIRFKITINTSSYSEGAGATLTGLRLEYMAKRGGMRSPNFG